MNKYECIAIAGNNGAGKTTLANYLNKLDPMFHNISFAAKLRTICAPILGIDPADLMKQEIKNDLSIFPGHSNRDILIKIAGTIRSMDDNYFVKETLKPIPGKILVIDDLRFDIEYNAIKKVYGDKALIILLETDIEEYRGDLMHDRNIFDLVLCRNTEIDTTDCKKNYMALHDPEDLWML